MSPLAVCLLRLWLPTALALFAAAGLPFARAEVVLAELEARREPSFRIRLGCRADLPPGTRLDLALSFAGRVVKGSRRSVAVQDSGSFEVLMESPLLARAGSYQITIFCEPRRQPRELLAAHPALLAPARWQKPVFVGTLEQELLEREGEADLIDAGLVELEAIIAAWTAMVDAAAPEALQQRSSVVRRHRSLQARIEALGTDQLLAAHFPDGCEALLQLTSLVGRRLRAREKLRDPTAARPGGDSGLWSDGLLDVPLETLQGEVLWHRTRNRRRRQALIGSEHLVDRAGALILEADAFFATEPKPGPGVRRRGIAGTWSQRAAEFERRLRGLELGAQALVQGPFVQSGARDLLLEVLGYQRRIQLALARVERERLGLPFSSDRAFVAELEVTLGRIGEVRSQREDRMRRLVALAESWTRQRAVVVGTTLKVLRRLRDDWSRVFEVREPSPDEAVRWRGRIADLATDLQGRQGRVDDPLAAQGGMRPARRYLQALSDQERALTTKGGWEHLGMEDLQRLRHLRQVIDRADRQLANLIQPQTAAELAPWPPAEDQEQSR